MQNTLPVSKTRSQAEYINDEGDYDINDGWLLKRFKKGAALRDMYNNEEPRRKRSPFCGRRNRCRKRSGSGSSRSLPMNPYISVRDKIARWETPSYIDTVPANKAYGRGDVYIVDPTQNRNKRLIEFYIADVDTPEVSKMVDRKLISRKKIILPRRLVKRSVKVDKGTSIDKEQKLRQYCMNHDCGKEVEENNSKIFDNVSKDSKTNFKPSSKWPKQTRIPKKSKNYMPFVNAEKEHNEASEALRRKRNPFCPPWGCGKKRKKSSARRDEINPVLIELVRKSLPKLNMLNKSESDNAKSTKFTKDTPIHRQSRLNLFCPYGGCRLWR